MRRPAFLKRSVRMKPSTRRETSFRRSCGEREVERPKSLCVASPSRETLAAALDHLAGGARDGGKEGQRDAGTNREPDPIADGEAQIQDEEGHEASPGVGA